VFNFISEIPEVFNFVLASSYSESNLYFEDVLNKLQIDSSSIIDVKQFKSELYELNDKYVEMGRKLKILTSLFA
ncbi:19755_t:CDS:2, partial [Funneliformis geosporum]